MKRVELKVARIGNSRGVRIPATTLERYRIGDSVVMEERSEGILLRPRRSAGLKLSWEATALAMSAEPEDWSEWDTALADGLTRFHGRRRRPSASPSPRGAIRQARSGGRSSEALRSPVGSPRSRVGFTNGQDEAGRHREPRRPQRASADRHRLSAHEPTSPYLAHAKAGELEGVVVDVKVGGIETVNCKATDPLYRDTHIEIADHMGALSTERVIVEVTPRWRAAMHAAAVDWTTAGLQSLIGKRVLLWLGTIRHGASGPSHEHGARKRERLACHRLGTAPSHKLYGFDSVSIR